MLNAIEGVLKPEYLLQPRRLLRRLMHKTSQPNAAGMHVLELPWGLSMEVAYRDDLARTIDMLGIYDLVVTEAIWRLLRPGDTALDVGANVGYMSLAMAARLRTAGRVFAFEPHPDLFGELARNLDLARAHVPGVTLIPQRSALSDATGTARLQVNEDFTQRRGISRLSDEGTEIATRRLDDMAGELGPDVAVMKVDVEGHEAAVFRGGRSLLSSGVVRHVIFEAHEHSRAEPVRVLAEMGFTMFALERTLAKPRLGPPSHGPLTHWEAPSLIATRHPGEVEKAFQRWGWASLAPSWWP